MILCSHFALTVRSNNTIGRYQDSVTTYLTCGFTWWAILGFNQ